MLFSYGCTYVGKSSKCTLIIIAVAIPAGLGVVFLFLACCFGWRIATKLYAVVQGDLSGMKCVTVPFTWIE